ncbi:MAG: cyclase family protein [Clostridia bacterium]
MEMIDISMTIDKNMPVYKNEEGKKPKITVTSDFSTGSFYETRIEMDMHTGTHIDMPLHMIQGGDKSEKLEIARLISDCIVLDLTSVKTKITGADLKEKSIKPGMFVLLKTRNSYTDSFNPEFVYLDASGAEYLKILNVNGVGIDSLGIERAQPNHETHKILFESGIIIIEGLRLSEVQEGNYRLIALPLKIRGTEAAPARVIILKE